MVCLLSASPNVYISSKMCIRKHDFVTVQPSAHIHAWNVNFMLYIPSMNTKSGATEKVAPLQREGS